MMVLLDFIRLIDESDEWSHTKVMSDDDALLSEDWWEGNKINFKNLDDLLGS